MDYYEAHDQETIEFLGKTWQQNRESGFVYHVCASGTRCFLTPNFFEKHWDDRHDCDEF